MLAGSTDNQGNSWLLSRLMTSKFPLLVVLGELAVQLRSRNLHLDLDWVPRDQNTEADALTNGDFSGFSPEHRVDIDVSRLEFKILPELLKAADDLFENIAARRRAGKQKEQGGKWRKQKLKERDPWS